MKHYYYLAVILLSLSACAKGDLDELGLKGNGCIRQVVTSPSAHEITTAQASTAARLFQQNGIALVNLRFTRFLEDDIVLNGSNSHYTHVSVLPYENGLPLLTGEVIYHFKNGVYNFLSGERLTTTVDPKPALAMPEVRTLYFEAFVQYEQKSPYKAKDFAGKCLVAELGYYNYRGYGMPNKTVRAWHVTPEGKSYPEAYLNDQDGTVIYFSDGIMTALPR